MSNSQWNQYRSAGEFFMRVLEPQRKDDEGKAAQALELRELLSAFIDASILKGFIVTDEQWNRACLLCGRMCPPFTRENTDKTENGGS